MGFITWDAEAAQAAINNGEQVVVNVWAEWCPSCIAQRRTLHAVLQQNPDAFADVKVFAINIDDRPRPQQVGSHRITGSAARTTLIFFNGGRKSPSTAASKPTRLRICCRSRPARFAPWVEPQSVSGSSEARGGRP